MTEEAIPPSTPRYFSVNQTDKGRGHIIIDYPRLPNRPAGTLVSELKTHCAQPRTPLSGGTDPAGSFLSHILRYAALAEDGRVLSGTRSVSRSC